MDRSLSVALRTLISGGGDQLWSDADRFTVRARAAQAIFFQGDPSDAVYLLLEGEIRLSVAAIEDGEETTTLLLRAPALLGLRDLLTNSRAQETATALVPSRILFWERADFENEWRSDADLRDLLTIDLARMYACATSWARLSSAALPSRTAALVSSLGRTGLAERPNLVHLAAALSSSEKSIAKVLLGLETTGLKWPMKSEEQLELLRTLGVDPEEPVYHSVISG